MAEAYCWRVTIRSRRCTRCSSMSVRNSGAAVEKLLRVVDQLIPARATSLFSAWSIADSDLAFMLHRLILNGQALPARNQAFAATQWQRPSGFFCCQASRRHATGRRAMPVQRAACGDRQGQLWRPLCGAGHFVKMVQNGLSSVLRLGPAAPPCSVRASVELEWPRQ